MSRQKIMHQLHQLMVKHQIRGASDFAEQVVAEAIHGTRQRSGVNKGFDIIAPGLGRVEVKHRWLPDDGRMEERVALNATKEDGFDYLALVIFHPDFQVKGAVLVPYAEAWRIVKESAYNRISFPHACTCNGAINISAEVAAAARR